MGNNEFKVIETQEDFDNAIRKRLAQKDTELAEKYKNYLSPDDVQKLKDEYDGKLAQSAADLQALTEKIANHDAEIADLTARAVKAETSLLRGQVASAHGIPMELSERLVGETREEIEKDAENFASFMKQTHSAPPARSTDPGEPSDGLTAAYAKLLSQMKEQN